MAVREQQLAVLSPLHVRLGGQVGRTPASGYHIQSNIDIHLKVLYIAARRYMDITAALSNYFQLFIYSNSPFDR